MSTADTRRLPVPKTHKLFINGEFPRSESGRRYALCKPGAARPYANLCLGSRKDLRAAVEAAKGAQHGWAARSAYNRGQILYRMAEMIEGRAESWQSLLRDGLGFTRRAGNARWRRRSTRWSISPAPPTSIRRSSAP
ncbi:MAG: aldehyde dehydrogenase family protein [Rhodanobacteraceae bacterium]|nr:aldehyde dehydrogenase family protein [Rhodanobacteraceae bacterium]